MRGRVGGARQHLREALHQVRRWKIPLGLADCVVGCAVVAFHTGDATRAAELLAAVRRAAGGGLRSPMSMCVYRHYVRQVRATMSPEARSAALEAGAQIGLDDAVARELA